MGKKHTLRDIFTHPKLPSLPSVAQKVFQHCETGNFDLPGLTDIIRFDPGLVCTFISHANHKSAGLREVSSVQSAVLACGPSDSLEILKNTRLLENCPELSPFKSMFEFGWHTCVSQALAAEALKQFGFVDGVSTMFVTGLLSDIGSLALMQTYPQEYYEQVWQPMANGHEIREIQSLELNAFGFSHVTVGHELARRWRLGEAFSSSILQHHEEVNGGFYSMTSQAASKIIELLDCKSEKDRIRQELDEQLKLSFELSTSDVDQLLLDVENRRQQAIQNLDLGCEHLVS